MNNKYDISMLSGLFPKETEKQILENSVGSVQNAANVWQWNLVRGLDASCEGGIKLINSLYIGSYPRRYKKAMINTYDFCHAVGSKDINVGFCNLSGLKHLSRYLHLKKYIRDWVNNGDENKILIAYAMTNVFLKSFAYAKRCNEKICTCMIVPDLPQYMNLSENHNIIYRLLKKYDLYKIKHRLNSADCYVLLTEQMNEILKVKRYIVIEGQVDINLCITENNISDKYRKKVCIYAGGVNVVYGIKQLVDAFIMADMQDAELHIYGNGDYEKELYKVCKTTTNVKYFGTMPNDYVIEQERKATLLINPRPTNNAYTNFSFPSKVLEYMVSGTPVLTTKLRGIPNDYLPYVYLFDDETVEGISKTLMSVLNEPREKMHERGIEAKKFVLENKNNIFQARKILDMVCNLEIRGN